MMPVAPHFHCNPHYAMVYHCICGHPGNDHVKDGCEICDCKSWEPESKPRNTYCYWNTPRKVSVG